MRASRGERSQNRQIKTRMMPEGGADHSETMDAEAPVQTEAEEQAPERGLRGQNTTGLLSLPIPGGGIHSSFGELRDELRIGM